MPSFDLSIASQDDDSKTQVGRGLTETRATLTILRAPGPQARQIAELSK